MFTEGIAYFFFGFAFLSSLLAVFARKTLYNVLSLIVLFFAVGVLFVFVHAAFLGMVLMIVYVGAVTVFFLFSVMMFGSRLEIIPKRSFKKKIGALAFGMLFLLNVCALLWLSYQGSDTASSTIQTGEVPVFSLIGELLYTTYVLPFQMVGLILFVAIIGGISLILKHRKETKRQDVFKKINKKDGGKVT